VLSIRVSQILTSREEDAHEAIKELEREIPFTKVVDNYSQCPSRQNQGDLGWGYEKNLPFKLGEKITSEDKGKIFGPIPTKHGYHIVKIADVREEEQGMKIFQKDTLMSELGDVFPDSHTILFNELNFIKPLKGYGTLDTLDSICWSYGKPVEDVVALLNKEYAKKRSVITAEDLKFKLDEQMDRMAVLDIREQWEYDIAKIEGSIHLTSENNQEIISKLGRGKEVVIVDWKEERSPSFQKFMMQFGFLNVKTLEGGIDAWAERIDTRLSRYTLDSDDGYRYEDILDQPEG
jgi:rhodanese-related sulfurtransferase